MTAVELPDKTITYSTACDFCPARQSGDYHSRYICVPEMFNEVLPYERSRTRPFNCPRPDLTRKDNAAESQQQILRRLLKKR